MKNSLARELADLLPQVLVALAVEDPRRGLEGALELLAGHGFGGWLKAPRCSRSSTTGKRSP